MADYTREWVRFQDWCAGTGRTPLPASTETVLTYLHEEQPARGTASGWIAAIRKAHQHAGHDDPCVGEVSTWMRRTRAGTATDSQTSVAAVTEPARRLPVTGWPTGMFARRDRLAFLLHHRAAIPARRLIALHIADVTVPVARTVEVTVDGTPVTVAEAPEAVAGGPAMCVACAVARWWWVLDRIGESAFRDMATSLSNTTPRSDHVCANAALLTTRVTPPAGWPVFPAIDRWGNLSSEPVVAMSLRAMEHMLRTVGRQEWHHATIPVPAPTENTPAASPPGPPSAPPVKPLIPAGTQQNGTTARARARESLDDVISQLDDLDAAIADLDTRVDHLMADYLTDPDSE